MDSAVLNTHTLYTDYARRLKKANDDIAQTAKYLEPDSPNYLPTYIQQLETLKNSANPPDGIEQKIALMRDNLANYQARYTEALAVLAEYPQKISALESANQVFQAPPGKTDEYLYVMDEESCQASCVNWQAVASNPGQVLVQAPVGQYRFQGRTDIELTGENQTDALRVWNNDVCVEGLCITDNRCYTEAHRDAIQLIPPALGKHEGGRYIRLADQMAGTIMRNVSVQSCQVSAPNGPLQGIFASDGMQRQLRILDNDISTQGAHSISIAGLLDGGEISGNVLRQVKGGELPQISLYPARIGGNMADDGVVCILSFTEEEGQERLAYEPVQVHKPNRVVPLEAAETDAVINDMRGLIPDSFLKLGVGLADFNYHAYLQEYSSLTLGQYCQRDPTGAEKMLEWLKLRTEEFAHGRAADNPLGLVSNEQRLIGERFLQPALQALQQGQVDNIRLVDLEYTAIRSFAMKRLAILNGRVEPLINIALLNPRREMMLKYLLSPLQLANVVSIAQLDVAAVCSGSDLPVPNLPFSLFFADNAVIRGTTDNSGRIVLRELPLGPCILRFDDPNFTLTTRKGLEGKGQGNAASAAEPSTCWPPPSICCPTGRAAGASATLRPPTWRWSAAIRSHRACIPSRWCAATDTASAEPRRSDTPVEPPPPPPPPAGAGHVKTGV